MPVGLVGGSIVADCSERVRSRAVATALQLVDIEQLCRRVMVVDRRAEVVRVDGHRQGLAVLPAPRPAR